MIIIIIILTFLVLIKIIILLLCQVGHSWRAEEQLFLWCGLRQGRDGEYTSTLIQKSVYTISCKIFAFVKIQISAHTWYNYYRSRDCKIWRQSVIELLWKERVRANQSRNTQWNTQWKWKLQGSNLIVRKLKMVIGQLLGQNASCLIYSIFSYSVFWKKTFLNKMIIII